MTSSRTHERGFGLRWGIYVRAIAIVVCVIVLAVVAPGVWAGPIARVYIAPGDVGLVVGANQQLRVIGEDADGYEVNVPSPVSWSASSRAGTITSAGLFTASYSPGKYVGGVTATVPGGFSAVANVEVYSNEARNGFVIERSIGSMLAGRIESPAAICVDPRGRICVVNRSTSVVSVLSWQGRPLFEFKLKDPIADGKTAVAQDSLGNFYVLNASLFKVQKYSSNGTFVTEWGSQGSSEGQFQEPYDLAVDADDGVYVSDYTGKCIDVFGSSGTFLKKLLVYRGSTVASPSVLAIGRSGCIYVGVRDYDWNIQKLDSRGNKIANVYSSVREPQDVTVDAGENLYVMLGHSAVEKAVSAYERTRIAGVFPLEGGLRKASGIAISATGTLYVADEDRSRINEFDCDGSFLGFYASGGEDKGAMNYPCALATDSQGNLYVADTGNKRVQKFDASGGFVRTLASKLDRDSVFACPAGVTCGPQDTLYLTDVTQNRLLGYNSEGTLQSNWTLLSNPIDSTLPSPMGIVWDSHGYIYAVDAYSNKVSKLDTNGNLLASWGSAGVANSQFNSPAGVDVDSAGNVYVTDHGNNRIQKFNSTGGLTTKWGTVGSGNGQMRGPVGICLDASNYVYIADSENCRVQKFSSTGSYMAQLGQFGFGRYDMFFPSGVHVGANNALWVADTYNQRVTKYVPAATRPISVTISSPTNAEVYYTSSISVNITGTTTGSVTSVKWANDCGGSGTCSGTSSWSASRIMLAAGPNVISVTARDLAGNAVTDCFTVVVDDTRSPEIAITDPVSGPGCTIPNSTLRVSGTAFDDSGVVAVDWASDRGERGTCTGTTSWSADVVLHCGDNVVTMTARDGSGNSASATITLTKNTPDWDIDVIDSDGDVGACCSMTRDWRGNPHIAYYDRTNKTLKHAYWDGTSWVKTVVDSNIGVIRPGTSIAANYHSVYIAYVTDSANGTNGDVRCATFDGTSWTTQVVDSDANDALYPSLGIDVWTATPSIAYYDRTNGDLKFATFKNLGWQIQTVDSLGDVGMRPSLAYDYYQCIAYADSSASGLKLATFNGSSWVIKRLSQSGGQSSSLCDSQNLSALYQDSGLALITNAAGTQSRFVIDNAASAGHFCSLGALSGSILHAAYWDSATQKVKYAAQTSYNSPWILQNVDFIGGSLSNPLMGISLAQDSSDNPCIFYYDTVNGDLKCAHTSAPKAPQVSVTTNQNNNGLLNLAGTASSGVTAVYWSNGRGDSGTCSGTTSWSVSGIPLTYGPNYIYISAPDSLGSTATICLCVVWAEKVAPTLTITSPTDKTQFAANASSLAIAGTASDNVGVESVTWSNSASGGSCTGTSNWSATVPLYLGTNYITVSAKDTSGNIGTDKLTVLYVSGTPKSIAQCKALSDSSRVYLADMTVSAVFNDCCYLEDRQKLAGIRLQLIEPLAGLVPGQVVNVAGTMMTAVNKERYIYGAVAVK